MRSLVGYRNLILSQLKRDLKNAEEATQIDPDSKEEVEFFGELIELVESADSFSSIIRILRGELEEDAEDILEDLISFID